MSNFPIEEKATFCWIMKRCVCEGWGESFSHLLYGIRLEGVSGKDDLKVCYHFFMLQTVN